MSTDPHELKAQLRVVNLKLKRRDDENRKLKEALRVLLAQNDSGEDHSDNDALDPQETADENDDDEMNTSEEDYEDLPEPIQSLEFSDVYVCVDIACGGEVVEGVCHWCGKKHQLLEDEFATRAISTESQTDHPDRRIAPRGDTPLGEIDPQTTVPREYESRQKEYLELLRRGATADMCKTFNLSFTSERGICAVANEGIIEAFAGPAMQEEDTWQIYLGRRVTLEQDDFDGQNFVTDLMDDISTLPTAGNWVTEEEYPGTWVTYPKYRGELETWPADKMDLTDDMPEDEELPVYDNDYDLSDDDSEQADLDMDDPALFITSGTVDRWYIDQDDPTPVDGIETEEGENSEMTEEESSACSSISDSDEAGSDFGSGEHLNGDEVVHSGSGLAKAI
ncbi:hypothetical protein CVT25_005412 [Psilocybe cyanescens]|uniref:DUF8191 domain-containing protein n=1 Tax=Psilocybe cyanescens TaxID=93625 RepID=A0A409WXD3_PSICY|nr:hypothetical protein CVT25_005412 [Psilocybe cyanescens]